jgi:hypothetical protein
MNNLDQNLQKIILKTAKAIYDGEEFLTTYLAAKAHQAAQENPYDSTLVGLSNFLNKKANAGQSLFVTRAELKDVYNKLYTNQTKTAQYFAKELGIHHEVHERPMLRDPNEGRSITVEAFQQNGNSFLAEQLSSVLNKEAPKQYSTEIASRAAAICHRQLVASGAEPKHVAVAAGNSDLLLCQASFETPKGQSHVIVPVEVRNNQPMIPNKFLSTAGFVDLNPGFLKEHLLSTAGKSYKIHADQLLQKLSSSQEELRPMSEVEKIVMKTAIKSNGGLPLDSMNNIYHQQVDPAQTQLETPVSPETAKFAERLGSDLGVAEFAHGSSTVESGRKMVLAELFNAGHRNAQVKVAGVSQDSINYAVSVGGKFGFNVPVKIKNRHVEKPKVVVAGGSIYGFDTQGISNLLASGDSDPTAVSLSSQAYGLNPTELVNTVRQALAEDNMLKAEDALQVLSTCGDKVAFQTGYSIYRQALLGELPKKGPGCSAPIKTANSKHVICSHTNLPVHKVYQDEHGNCRPLYRRGMEESYQGAYFNNSKIFG